MLPHARDEIAALAEHSNVVTLASAHGWAVERWLMSPEDIERAVDAYQALLAIEVEDDVTELLVDMGVERLGPPATTKQHAKIMRADAIEVVAAATVIAVDNADIDDLHMPNVPKMAGRKSDSGIDVIACELNPDISGPIDSSERLILVSVKHTIDKYASGMRALLEKSVSADLSGPYLYSQLRIVNGRMIQSGESPRVAKRVFYFLRETLTHPSVRVVCVAAAAPPPQCNLLDQPAQLEETMKPDAHFRMILISDVKDLHKKLVPGG